MLQSNCFCDLNQGEYLMIATLKVETYMKLRRYHSYRKPRGECERVETSVLLYSISLRTLPLSTLYVKGHQHCLVKLYTRLNLTHIVRGTTLVQLVGKSLDIEYTHCWFKDQSICPSSRPN